MKKESNKNWTTCLRLNTGDGSPRVFLLNSHFLGSVPFGVASLFVVLLEVFFKRVCNTFCDVLLIFFRRNHLVIALVI